MNLQTKEQIIHKVHNHYDKAKELYGERVLGVFLVGSQNYNMAMPDSDVDTKCLVMPSVEDIIRNKQALSTVYHLSNDEQMDCKDVREFIRLLNKPNPNWLEVLFSDYVIVSPSFLPCFTALQELREPLAKQNRFGMLCALNGTLKSYAGNILHENADDTSINYDIKALYRLLYTYSVIKKYVDDYDYRDCMKCNSEALHEFREEANKGHIILDYSFAKGYAQYYVRDAEERIEAAKEFLPKNNIHVISKVNNIFQDFMTKELYKALKEQINNE